MMPDPEARWRVDLYMEGCCVYQLDAEGEIESVQAWARNSIVARAAYDKLRKQYPQNRYAIRQRSFDMGDSAEEDG